LLIFFFFFKQKTAYEIVCGDWSSDVCSSDLLVVFDLLRLGNRQSEIHRRLLYGRSCQFHTSPLRAVGLRDYKLQIVSCGRQPFQTGHGKLRRAAEHQLHAHSPARMSFLILRVIRSRFKRLMWLI